MATKDYYKGVTIQYKGDNTQLSKVLADMNSQMRQSQGAARQLDAALRMDPKSMNLIKDRAEVVAKQIKVTEERVEALKQALQNAKDPEVITRLNQQVDIAEAKLKNLSEYHKFREIQAQNTFKAYLGYLNDNPDGAFREEAEAGIFELVKEGNRLKDYEIYLKRFPNGRYVEEAKQAIQNANSESPSMIEVQTEQQYIEETPAEEEHEKPASHKKAKKSKPKPKKKGKKK